ncbi:Holliday junction resolvase RuvX [Halorhodospira halophila]|uniref:Putative pre-16S rRNA nuclease n=1 Tax=Halorhodospira halophila (strain DSM 244 / SL1) TaxID=349124 RepID=A1WVK3_HALHL|nr:Holliday junction resolvase RuvX [Halorhodospira halophila]ABM61715.1 Holliday junction resolvase YqgF [Halorhodospira halophila SL1]MBK1728955.1 Holliday junction resolvase RuvX [Halorhodospira halophila]
MPEPPGGTLLGFDPGARHIGVAVGEALLGTARGLTTLPARHGQPDWEAVSELLAQWTPEALVVGLPSHADGSDADSTELARRLAGRLHGRFGLPVHTVDERLSSHVAEERLDPRQRQRDPHAVHAEAAAVILETFFAQQGVA